MRLLSDIIRSRVYNTLAPLQFSFLFVRFETLLKYSSLQSDAGWEEYYDYIFPDDEANMPNFKTAPDGQALEKEPTTNGIIICCCCCGYWFFCCRINITNCVQNVYQTIE